MLASHVGGLIAQAGAGMLHRMHRCMGGIDRYYFGMSSAVGPCAGAMHHQGMCTIQSCCVVAVHGMLLVQLCGIGS